MKKKEVRAKDYVFAVTNEYEKKVSELIIKLGDLCEGEDRHKKYASAILTLIQYFCGVNDFVKSVTIKAEDARGEPYEIVIS
jgi:predicted SpoU family rRNA methylase